MRHKMFYFVMLILLLSACSRSEDSGNIWVIRHSAAGHEIFTFNPINLQEHPIIHTDRYIQSAGLSPDGKRILYLTAASKGNLDTWIADLDGSNSIKIQLDFSADGFVSLDNDRVLFGGLKEGYITPKDYAFQWELYDFNTRQIRPLIWQGPWIPSGLFSLRHYNRRAYLYSDDQPILTFGHLDVQGDTIHLVIESQVSSSLIPPGIIMFSDSSTPDGSEIAFGAKGGKNNNDVFVGLDKGRSIRQLTDFEKDYGVSGINTLVVSPNGKWVIFLATLGLPHSLELPTEGQIVLASTDGKIMKFIQKAPNGIDGDFVWSPDSRYVAVGTDPDLSGVQIYVIDVRTMEVRKISSDGWSKEVFAWR